MRVISYSLWGNRKLYTHGAIANGEQARIIYPGWKTRIAVHKDVEKNIIYKLESIFDMVEIYSDAPNYGGLFWRFDSMVLEDIEVSLFRDCDSRLSDREYQAVQEWLKSDKQIHNMRDHIYHYALIMGGLWGIKRDGPINIRLFHKMIMAHNFHEYGCDQRILRRMFGAIRDDVLSHDDSLRCGGIKFPPHAPLKEGNFLGDCIVVEGETNIKYDRYKK